MGSEMSVIVQERDLGVLVESSKKVSLQFVEVVKKVNFMLVII